VAGTWRWYGRGLLHVLAGDVSLRNGSLKVMLTGDSYLPNLDNDEFRSDVTDEVAGSGYTQGGLPLANFQADFDVVTDEAIVGWADVLWTGIAATVQGAVIYHARGGAASADEVLACVVNDAPIEMSGGPLTLDLDQFRTLSIPRE